MLMFFFTNISY